MNREKIWYVADFETTGENFYNQNGYTKVWLYAISDMNGEIVNFGQSIEEFMAFIKTLYGKTIYFHNLKFDGSFILDYLLKMGYPYIDNLSKDNNKGVSVLIGDMGEFYSIDIRIGKNKTVHIHDSLKLLPFKVESIAKDFELPMLKGKIDYDNYVIDETTLSYVFNDVKIVALALKEIKANGMSRMTTASSAYNNYIAVYTPDYVKSCYPSLSLEFLREWREAYRGGRSMVNPKYAGQIVENVKRFDINSMYPHIMRNLPLPYGDPIPIKRRGDYKFELYHIFISFKLKKGHLPSLLKKAGLFNGADSYYTETDFIEEMWISNIDYELVERNYDIKYVDFVSMYGFLTTTILFKKYIDIWYERKQKDKGAKRIVDKLMLNSLYGKFGTNCEKQHKIPYIDDNGIVSYELSEVMEGTHYYLPVAIAITSWAHRLLDNAIHLTGIDNFVYCDTDSIHTLGELPEWMIDDVELGKFKLEAIETKAKYIRQKCYATLENGEYHITCAGMPESSKKRVIEMSKDNLLNDFKTGLLVNGKLLPKRVPGGTILYETTFEIK